jgi:hypothetical protein
MSLADHQTSAPPLGSLPGLPYELSVAVIEQCDMPVPKTSRPVRQIPTLAHGKFSHRGANLPSVATRPTRRLRLLLLHKSSPSRKVYNQTHQRHSRTERRVSVPTLLHTMRHGQGPFRTREHCEARRCHALQVSAVQTIEGRPLLRALQVLHRLCPQVPNPAVRRRVLNASIASHDGR